jgi:hypothetical protein
LTKFDNTYATRVAKWQINGRYAHYLACTLETLLSTVYVKLVVLFTKAYYTKGLPGLPDFFLKVGAKNLPPFTN